MNNKLPSFIIPLLMITLTFFSSLQAETFLFEDLAADKQEIVRNYFHNELLETDLTDTQISSLFNNMSEEQQDAILYPLSSAFSSSSHSFSLDQEGSLESSSSSLETTT